MIPWWLSTRGSRWCFLLLLGTVRGDTIFLSNGHVDQLIISIWLNKVQAFLELGVEATTKTVVLLGVSIRMMACVLAQVIEDLCILKNSAGPLIQSQEFIQLPLNQCLGEMMCPKGIPEFFPRDNMSSRLHSTIVIPPNASGAMKLLGGELSLVRISTRYC